MIWIMLKFALVVILTAIPFLYAGLIKPKQAKDADWKNLFTLAESKKGYFQKKALRIKAWLYMFYDKMKENIPTRKFFTLVVAMTLLTYQFADFKASNEAVYKNQQSMVIHEPLMYSVVKIESLSQFPYSLCKKSFANFWYSFVSAPVAYISSIILTFMLFSYKLADKILTMIHQDDNFNVLLGVISFVFLYLDEGRYLLLSQVILIMLLAGRFYPTLHSNSYCGSNSVLTTN